MQQSRWARANVKCPFWRGDGMETVSCEGPFCGVGITMKFRSDRKRKHHMEVFCAEHYEKCEIYRMVMDSKYADL